jgi:hypothetical protein
MSGTNDVSARADVSGIEYVHGDPDLQWHDQLSGQPDVRRGHYLRPDCDLFAVADL